MTTGSAADLLARLGRTPALVRAGVARIPDTAHAPGSSGEWSPAQIVVHLAAVDADVWGPRLRQLAVEGHPRWAWTEPDMTGTVADSIDAALDAFAAGRATLLALAAGLDTDGWRRTGTHAAFGELDAEGLLREALAHDAEHLADLAARAGQPPDA